MTFISRVCSGSQHLCSARVHFLDHIAPRKLECQHFLWDNPQSLLLTDFLEHTLYMLKKTQHTFLNLQNLFKYLWSLTMTGLLSVSCSSKSVARWKYFCHGWPRNIFHLTSKDKHTWDYHSCDHFYMNELLANGSLAVC